MKIKQVTIKEPFVIIGGGVTEAYLLDRILSQSEGLCKDLMEEELQKEAPLTGWVRESAQSLSEHFFGAVTGRTIQRGLEALVSNGLLLIRKQGLHWEYRPNITEIQIRCMERGYVLDGYKIPNSMDRNWNEGGRDQYWESIPKATTTNQEVTTGWRDWVKNHRLLDNVPDHIKYVSYLIGIHTRFEPVKPIKTWVRQCEELYEASGKKSAILVQGLRDGEAARSAKGLTFSGPRAYVAYVRNAATKIRLTVGSPVKEGLTVGSPKRGLELNLTR